MLSLATCNAAMNPFAWSMLSMNSSIAKVEGRLFKNLLANVYKNVIFSDDYAKTRDYSSVGFPAGKT